MAKKKKFKEAVWDRAPIKPKNDKQKQYINAIANSTIVVGTGVAGSGKTALASWLAVDMLQDNRTGIEKIIIARPNEIEGTKSIGALPGTKEEKMEPWAAPVAESIKQRIGASHYKFLMERGVIEILPLEFIKGRTFNNTFVIVDEAEDIEWSILKTLILRVGQDSRLVIDGDVRQTSIKKQSGLATLLDKVLPAYDYLPIMHVDFPDWSYCVRSKECQFMGQVFEDLSL